jgi:hypothetical protein
MVKTKGVVGMEGEESSWSNLGSSLGMGITELTDRIQKLEALIQAMQGDFITSIEAIQRRLNRVEDGKPLESIFDVMTQEEVKNELGVEIGIKDDDDESDDDESFVVESGFMAPPPAHREVEVDVDVLDVPGDGETEVVTQGELLKKTIEAIEELSTEEEFAAINKVAELVDEEHPELLDEESGVVDWGDDPVSSSVGRIVGHIGEHGGVVNQYLKRWDLIPPDADKAFRSSLVKALGEAGVQTLKVNRIRHFYTMEGDDAGARYAALYG